MYVPVDLKIELAGIVIWNEKTPINIYKNAESTYASFLHYKKSLLKGNFHYQALLLT